MSGANRDRLADTEQADSSGEGWGGVLRSGGIEGKKGEKELIDRDNSAVDDYRGEEGGDGRGNGNAKNTIKKKTACGCSCV